MAGETEIPPWTIVHGAYSISDDPARLDLGAIHGAVSREHWAIDRPRELVARAIAHSLCLGAYTATGEQAGFLRIVTDRAVYAYLDDVLVFPGHRGQGLGKALIAAALAHPELATVAGWALRTRDAHGLYAQYGFIADPKPQNAMRRIVSPVDVPLPQA